MTGEQKKEKIAKLEEAACIARGHIIHRVIEIETVINYYLSNHFTKDVNKRRELQSLLFFTERIGYKSKVEIFCSLVKTYEKQFSDNNPQLQLNLDRIGKIRNQLAHQPLNITDEGLKKEDIIGFAKWKNDKIEIVNYSYENINLLIAQLYDCFEILSRLIK